MNRCLKFLYPLFSFEVNFGRFFGIFTTTESLISETKKERKRNLTLPSGASQFSNRYRNRYLVKCLKSK